MKWITSWTWSSFKEKNSSQILPKTHEVCDDRADAQNARGDDDNDDVIFSGGVESGDN